MDHPQKLVFKFVINDSNWCIASDLKVEHDEHGNANNYVDAAELKDTTEIINHDEYDLAQVLTNPSSYDAISPPASSGSGFEHLSKASMTRNFSDEVLQVEPSSLQPQSETPSSLLPQSGTPSSLQPESNQPSSPQLGTGSASSPQHQPHTASSRNAHDDDTPTNSIFDGEGGRKRGSHQKQKGAQQSETKESEVATLGGDSRRSSITGRIRQSETKADASSPLVKVPGSYPDDDRVTRVSSVSRPRKEGFINRLKGLFGN